MQVSSLSAVNSPHRCLSIGPQCTGPQHLHPNVQTPLHPKPLHSSPRPLSRHAAASYGHLHVLDFLISRGGDVNVADSDGDTPLYTVENLQTAQFLVDHGALVNRANNDGLSPADALADDFPDVAAYLAASTGPAHAQPSQHSQEAASEQLTSSLMRDVEDIMTRAEAEGRDPDAELRAAVERTVVQGVVSGYSMASDAGDVARRDGGDGDAAKRRRLDD
ncbi:hypothetical protein FA95DRAFT_1556459 [Auriscalpium vulgare]|uniref:Uncharacterized protein n=1 Tax=Auriscalpium vulgare TaxID=40419 RepID=A0ACB8S0W4_9AGAM|nr:hypothetical protein FA95DRAFT_1556459 [Auriscalpium vulgare]